MDTLKNKVYTSYDYLSRYTSVPNYYDTLADRDVTGIGSNMFKVANPLSHKVKPTDTLDSLALRYYNNPTYWWIIAYYNDIQDCFIKLSDYYSVLQIPNISEIQFGRTN